jgi:hypothetical protein
MRTKDNAIGVAVLLRNQSCTVAKFTIIHNSALRLTDCCLNCCVKVNLWRVPLSIVRPLRSARASTTIAALIFVASNLVASSAAHADRVRNACSGDYHRFCSQYRPDSSQMRACMQANGRSLSSSCINALVDAGVVDRRFRR